MGWEPTANGALLKATEDAGFDLLLSTDKNIRYQQNLAGRKIALVVLGNQQWPVAKQFISGIFAAINVATPGSYFEIKLPFE